MCVGEVSLWILENSVSDQPSFYSKRSSDNIVRVDIEIHAIFIDFKRAYDSVKWGYMFQAMDSLGIPIQLTQPVVAIYSGSKSSVKINDRISECFDVNMGLRQGNPLSTLLLNLVMEKIIHDYGINRPQNTTKVTSIWHTSIQFSSTFGKNKKRTAASGTATGTGGQKIWNENKRR